MSISLSISGVAAAHKASALASRTLLMKFPPASPLAMLPVPAVSVRVEREKHNEKHHNHKVIITHCALAKIATSLTDSHVTCPGCVNKGREREKTR